MPTDFLLLLIIILAVVLYIRGPKTLPKLGSAFGRGVKAVRDEATEATKGLGGDDTTGGTA